MRLDVVVDVERVPLVRDRAGMKTVNVLEIERTKDHLI
jgi:hypothetical protein